MSGLDLMKTIKKTLETCIFNKSLCLQVFMKGTSINGVDAKTVVEFLEVHFNNQTIVLKLQDKDKKSPVQAVVREGDGVMDGLIV